ncbi:MotA/TolQ/ExbB proton channel family protein [Pirellulaceae bacterium SH449]
MDQTTFQSFTQQAKQRTLLFVGLVSAMFVGLYLAEANTALGQVSEVEIAKIAGEAAANRAAPPERVTPKTGLNLLNLAVQGGFFMIPIGIVSLVVVTFVFDRLIGLRSARILPSRFKKSLSQFSRQLEADPRLVYQSCIEHPSAAANVVKEVVLRIGRPTAEIEAAAAESIQREVDAAYVNVKWINFAAAVAPLLGLLGTVWGLIRAFHDTTQLTAGQNRADFLAVGIYEALVTTLAGLIVAIPAAACAQFFESRIQKMFAKVEAAVAELIPRFEIHEGRTRFEVIGKELAPREVTGRPSVVAPPVSHKI